MSYYGVEQKQFQLPIDEENCLYLYEAIELRPDMREKTLKFIIQHFSKVSQHKHMFELPSHLLATIIQSIGKMMRVDKLSVTQ